MKCIKHVTGKVARVSNEKAAEAVKTGQWRYTNKGEWKAAGRPR